MGSASERSTSSSSGSKPSSTACFALSVREWLCLLFGGGIMAVCNQFLSTASIVNSLMTTAGMDIEDHPFPTSSASSSNLVNQTSATTAAASAPLQGFEPPPIDFCKTSSTGWEVVFESILGGLIREDEILPEGSILDVGAQFGEQACHFARLQPRRIVHAMDPSPKNVDRIREKFSSRLPNLQLHVAGVGMNRTTRVVPDTTFQMEVGATFTVETIDALFFDKGEQLAFAHLDVEGFELDTLIGGEKTIRANKPIFTAEVRVHKDPQYTKDLLDLIDRYGYDAYMVDEVCGFPHMDFRNLLCVPRPLSSKLVHSDTFNLALSSEAIQRVDAESLPKIAYPCCVLGGECCPNGDGNDCCHQRTVLQWLKKNGIKKPGAMTSFNPSKRLTDNRWRELNKRAAVP